MNKIDELIKEAIREKNSLKVSVYRQVKTKLQKMLTEKGRKSRELTDEDFQKAVKKEFKEIKEELKFVNPMNSAIYKALCAKLSYLDIFIARTMGVDEMIKLIKKGIEEKGNNIGLIMKYLKETGKPINMREASKKVKEMINK